MKNHSSWQCVEDEKFIKKRRSKRFLVCKLFEERKSSEFFHVLTKELEMFDREYFSRLFRISPDRYLHLLSKVGQRRRTHLREPISTSEHLCLTLPYLASGESQQSLSFAFRISCTAISNILADTCLIHFIWYLRLCSFFKDRLAYHQWWLFRRLEYRVLYWCNW